MDIVFEWLSFLTRWLHVMAGITWIGTSFYFNWFDASVRPPAHSVLKSQIRGTLEEVHGGSFYYHEQYWPQVHPDRLLVHAWPAKTTFYTGLLLMTLLYWLGADTYLVDKQVADISAALAVSISVGSMLLAWAVYVTLCRLFKQDQWVFLGMSVWVLCSAYAFTHVFGGRGAFISMGAMLGALMGLNVIRHIVPNHIAMRQQLSKQQSLDTALGAIAKRHSQHNNYFTIPVVVCMLSNHFAIATQHHWSWLILSLLLLAGWAVRHYLNLLYKTEQKKSALLGVIVLSLMAAIALTLLPVATPALTSQTRLNDVTGMQLIQAKCATCHASQPSQAGFAAAPQGLVLETLAQVRQHKNSILYQVVVSKNMPLGNVTGLTEEERAQLNSWLQP